MSFLAADALRLLCNAHTQDRMAHAYLITGPEGSGKRQLVTQLTALIIGQQDDPLRHPDVHVIEPESKSRRIRTEVVRELERQLQMRSLRGGKKVGIFFDADRLQEQAANAFLKTLEEPPAHTHLFLVSSLPDQLLETILSRCIQVPLQRIDRRISTPLEQLLLTELSNFGRHPRPELPEAFLLVRRFQELLGQAKERIQDENAALLKKEEPLYKQSGNKDAFEEREDYFKALTESRYIGERSRLLAIFEQWWADVLRLNVSAGLQQNAPQNLPPQNLPPQNQPPQNAAQLDHPEFAESTAALAARFTPAQLLKKLTFLQQMRENLGRNVQEQLSIEVGLLNAFGTAKAS